MFRHQEKRRTFKHNMRLASLLSTVAGIVNITGLLSLGTLTTNVTGHFAFFSDQLFYGHYGKALLYVSFVLFFLMGAFTSNLIMELAYRKHRTAVSYMIPISIEIVALSAAAFYASVKWSNTDYNQNLAAFFLLFAMGLQNALVTRVSQSVVRTTHLTGLFTDLGIALSQLLFKKNPTDKARLSKNITLKLMIITGFFTGGIIGAYLHQRLHSYTLFIAVFILLCALLYDRLLVRFYHIKRHLLRKHVEHLELNQQKK